MRLLLRFGKRSANGFNSLAPP
ncbi:hypothetical protein SPHINGOR109_50580 [Sphingorhabdus sp. 109]|nr:hypothetical protein SPHINGOR109_50580 [Sphingorhabdus sp. 109]